MSRIGVALSGGGHRSGLFSLGVLLYLADSGKSTEVVSISSVSGGSLTNGYIAQALDYRETSSEAFRDGVAPLARRLARTGTLFPPSVSTAGYLLLVLLVVFGGVIGIWFLPVAIGFRVGAFVLGVVVISIVAGWRGRVCSRAFARTLYSPKGQTTRLDQCHAGVDHILCATDLHAGEHVYFSPRFVCSYRFGWGTPGDLPLHIAVQCSAALPGAFPPIMLPTSRHAFVDGMPEAAGTSRMALVDGGVYDNMADQWMIGLASRLRRWQEHTGQLRVPEEIIIVNGSAGLGWGPVRRLGLPLIGEIAALLRDKTVLYDNGNTVRRELALERFRSGRPRGCLVDIGRSPLYVADTFAGGSDEAAVRAQAVRALLEPDREEWTRIAELDARLPTTLWGFKGPAGARLMRHAYVLAMANLHVLLGYPLLEVPAEASFAELTS